MTEDEKIDFSEDDVKRTRKQTKVKLPKKLEREEVELLLETPNRGAITGLRNRCMLELMYRSGLRVSEVCNLTHRDINVKKRRVSVWDGKGGDRTAGWGSGTSLDIVLDEWIRRRKTECEPSKFFFSTIDGGQVSTRYVQQMMKRVGKRAGFTEDDLKLRITPHKLRHTFATEYLEAGGTIENLQLLLGHKNVSTTQIYMHIDPENALDSLDLMARRRKR